MKWKEDRRFRFAFPVLGERGYSLPLVLMVTSALVLSALAGVQYSLSPMPVENLVSGKRKLAPQAEGMMLVVIQLSRSYFADRRGLNGIEPYLNSQVPNLVPAGTKLENFSVNVRKKRSRYALASGPYKGMNAEQMDVFYSLTLSDLRNPNVSERVEVMTTFSGISFFQFAFFDFDNIFLWHNSNYVGRVHANGNGCLGGRPGDPGYASSITVAGRMLDPNGPECFNGTVPGMQLFAATNPQATTFAEFNWSAMHGCTNCEGTGLDWQAYALEKWKGNVRDVAHDVQPLEILSSEVINDASIQMQNSWGHDFTPTGRSLWNSGGKESLIIQPVLPGEPLHATRAKLAHQADIRIINGVWYIRNPADEFDWPGIPVWSDHPGRFNTEDAFEGGLIGETSPGVKRTIAVGQKDIADYWNARGPAHAWGSTLPQLYSYYRYDDSGRHLTNGPEAVVSYGNLKRIAVNRHKPGFLLSNEVDGAGRFADRLCSSGNTCTNCASSNEMRSALQAGAVTCSAGGSPNVATQLLFATRSGYRNGNIQDLDFGIDPNPVNPSVKRINRSKQLPMNFDFERFQEAMRCPSGSHPGEIGCFFKTGGFIGRQFNGILFITSTWDNWNDAYCDPDLGPCPGLTPGRVSPYAPFQGSIADASQVGRSHPAQQEALPYALCSSSGTGGQAGQSFDDATAPRFRVPDCQDYRVGAVNYKPVNPNIIRYHNMANLDPAVFPAGLSLVTNILAETVGNVNTSSNISAPNATPWLPLMLTGDTVYNHSGNWRDETAPWHLRTDDPSLSPRTASPLRTNFAVLRPFQPHPLEDFRGVTRRAHTAQVGLREAPVHLFTNAWGWMPGPANGELPYPADDVNEYDRHFEKLDNQPPGTPVINVVSIRNWNASGGK